MSKAKAGVQHKRDTVLTQFRWKAWAWLSIYLRESEKRISSREVFRERERERKCELCG